MSESTTDLEERNRKLSVNIWLTIAGMVWQSVQLIMNIVSGGSLLSSISTEWSYFYLVMFTAYIVCLVAAWQRNKWGCFGYIILGLVGGSVAVLFHGYQWTLFALSIIGAILALVVYKSNKGYFEEGV